MTATPAADGRYLRELLGVPFSDEQLAVVVADPEPQLVIAGAGSGKTTVMAARVVHAVAWHGVRPDAVLGLTFTNKAATELAERVRLALATLVSSGLLQPSAEDPLAPTLDDQPTVSTYHAYAASLIKDHALRIGREPDSRLLTEAARWQLALRVVQSARGPFAHLNWTTPTVTQHVLDLDGELSEHLVGSDEVRAFDAKVIAEVEALPGKPVQVVLEAAARARSRDELLGLVDAYRDRKRALDLVDFGDQVALAAEIARLRLEVGEGERARFAMVFLDEYQDTGVAQRVLLSSLFGDGHPVTAVGDPCQSIYGWRGASIGNLLRFTEHFPREDRRPFAPLELLTSFRNGEQILRGANTLSGPLRAFVEGRRRPHVEVHELSAGRDEPGEVLTSLHETVVDESHWLAARVREAVDAGTPPGEVAVLCRRRSDFGVFHRALVALDLPVEVVGLGGLLEMPEVADVVAILQLLADATANAAAIRVLTGPRYRIGPRDLKALGTRASHLAQTGGDGRDAADPDGTRALARAASSVDSVDVVALSDAIDSPGDPSSYSPEGYSRLLELRTELTRLRPLLTQPIVEAAVGVVAAIGLDVEIEGAPAELGAAMAANLSAFLDHAARFEGIEGESDLVSFLAFLEAAGDKENGLDIGGVSSADTVKLMTVHKAKGLEWDVVAIPSLVRKVFPSGQGRPRWTSRAEALPFDLRGDCADLPVVAEWSSKSLGGFKSACDEDDLEEERRLAYVAVTRARRLLLASGHLWGRTRSTVAEPSVFLQELREALPPVDPGRQPWFVADQDPAGNPLREQGEPDVAWPAAYREEPFARRLAAAELVRDALEHPVEVSDVFDPEVAEWDREVGQLLDELAAARAPVRDVLLPRTLSASQVVALAEDADDFARSLARPMPRKPSSAARRGTAFHAWVEHLFDARPLFDTDELAGAADLPDEPDVELADLRAAFAQTPYGELKPYAVEAPFELVVGGRLLRGRIDAVYRSLDDPDGFDVVDYKTGLRPNNPKAVALQLAIYRLAWAGIAGVPVESVGAGFLYVRTGELVRPPLAGVDEIAALLSDGVSGAEVTAPSMPEPPHLDTPSVASAMTPPPEPPPDDQDDSGQLALDWG